MEDFANVECFEASDYLDKDIPDLLFFDVGLTLLIVADLLEHVAIVCILHHQAQT